MRSLFKNEYIILPLFCIVYVTIGLGIHAPTMHSLGVLGWFGLAQLAYSIVSWTQRGNEVVSPYIIFLLALYVFSFGQSFIWCFGVNPDRSLVGFQGITINEIFEAQILTLLMLAFFHIGAVYSLRRKHSLNLQRPAIDYTRRLKQIGWFLFLISAYPYITETINDAILSMRYGYGALFEGTAAVGFDNLPSFIAGYFIPSVICLFIAYKDTPSLRIIFTCILILDVMFILITGGRSNAVIIIALLLILYNYLVKRFTRKWLLVGTFGVLLLLRVLSFIGEVRMQESRTLDYDGTKIESNAAFDAIAEMGGSMFCLIKTMDLVPSKDSYRYGRSYAFAFTTLIPNLGFWDIHPAKKESNLSGWLTSALGLSYGTGFSMCAEAYANFGYFGIMVFFFWGWFLASIFGKIEISVATRNYALLAFVLILFWYFLKLPRNNFINLVRPIFYVAGPIYLYCTNFKLK